MKIIVMLIAAGIHGPATLSGFDTIAACNAARPIVMDFFKKATRSNVVVVDCVELAK